MSSFLSFTGDISFQGKGFDLLARDCHPGPWTTSSPVTGGHEATVTHLSNLDPQCRGLTIPKE